MTEKHSYISFTDQQLDEWNVCAKYNGNTYPLYSNNHYGTGNITGAASLQCDLALHAIENICTTSH